MLPLPNNFRYLNREKRWLGFYLNGLRVTSDGALELLPSPRLIGPAPDLSHASAPDAPAGVAVDASGRVFYSVPDENKIFSFGGCSAEPAELKCLVESSGLPPLNAPRGLLLLEKPHRLAVVDSGNHRILFFDPATFELRDLWGQDDVAANPVPDSAPGRFNTPWTVSADGDGNLYVLDYGNRRVQKLRATGDPEPEFAEHVRQSNLAPHPGALAVAGEGDEVSIFIYDVDAQVISVFDSSGAPLLDAEGDALAIQHDMTRVLALAANASTLYAGDNNLRRVLAFDRSPKFPSGEAAGFEGPVAALAIAPQGGLVVRPSGGVQPLLMSETGAYLTFGALWSPAISSGKLPGKWSRLRAEMKNTPGSHIEFFYSLSNDPGIPTVYPWRSDPFSNKAWKSLPPDVEDFLLCGEKAQYLFVGAVFRGDGTGTNSLKQLRADFDDPGYLPYLPVIYRQSLPRVEDPNSPAPPAVKRNEAHFVRRLVALYQGIFDDMEIEIDSLPQYFNPRSAPPEALEWLAGWLALDLDQGEPQARIRSGIAQAFRRYQWRGTAEGLRLALLEEAGVHANIVQPIANASFWAFPGDTHCSGVPSMPAGVQLGGTTHLPSAQPGGAVLGSTAELDHSYLITSAEFGQPLFEGTANQFIVEVYSNEVGTEARKTLVHEIVEREKPAHTMWRLAVVDPSMRTGFQSRVGIDSIVAGTAGASALGVADSFGGLRLGGGPPVRVGYARLGQDLKLH
jgi:phage tail-like protein